MTRHVAVTGAASGIGHALAALLTARGDEVIGVDLADAEVCADLSTPDGRASAVGGVLERCDGVLDALITCAGVAAPGRLMISVNYFGTTELVTALRPALAAADRPRVGVVGSISGTQQGDPRIVAACLSGDESLATARAEEAVARGDARQLYPSSKAALAQWLRRTCVSPGWADAGIPLNAVAPGVVLTPMSAELVADERMREVMREAVPMPLNGYADPETVAHALAWLTAPENSHITGQVVYVDGGAEATLRGPEQF
ncbi:SDR family oxidoreductase [Streptomyces sp. NBC_01387]|uniref:SDR family oxidoreductase n=1 Tax=unclassified Streptomyces TaxID=2593676 RepID=UPI0020258CAC|nr:MULTISPECIES: SDR family oxidoreductase [unclassified Streptomyces]MCX4552833.1 SDR family oxidoreductase [Streptomyces sp. NBC_01500]WSC24164.1 SDR family oxidoreductase [Streptomyces sp. NBC_01766]